RAAAHVWGGERRGLFLVRREEADLPVHTRRLPGRPDLHDERRRQPRAEGEHGERPVHMLVLLPGREAHPLLLDAPSGPEAAAEAGLFEGLRLAALSDL